MRGKVCYRRLEYAKKRITPAYAGKSGRVCGLKICHWDHPRLCGEKSGNSRRNNPHMGSPPPMRGKEHNNLLDRMTKGITPAYAGKSIL